MVESNDIFIDIFRRADQNDDGKISLAEFKNYFCDGTLGDEKLLQVFKSMDIKHNDNIDIEELHDYFKSRLGSFETVFRSVAQLNNQVNIALHEFAKDYVKLNWEEQFFKRFLLHELSGQLSALMNVIDASHNHLAADVIRQNSEASVNSPAAAAAVVEMSRQISSCSTDGSSSPSILRAGRHGRRERRQFSTQTSQPFGFNDNSNYFTTGVETTSLAFQVQRLQSLLDQAELKFATLAAIAPSQSETQSDTTKME